MAAGQAVRCADGDDGGGGRWQQRRRGCWQDFSMEAQAKAGQSPKGRLDPVSSNKSRRERLRRKTGKSGGGGGRVGLAKCSNWDADSRSGRQRAGCHSPKVVAAATAAGAVTAAAAAINAAAAVAVGGSSDIIDHPGVGDNRQQCRRSHLNSGSSRGHNMGRCGAVAADEQGPRKSAAQDLTVAGGGVRANGEDRECARECLSRRTHTRCFCPLL